MSFVDTVMRPVTVGLMAMFEPYSTQNVGAYVECSSLGALWITMYNRCNVNVHEIVWESL